MINQEYSAKIQRFQELFITTILGDLPTIVMGPQLRRFVYRNIFKSIGNEVFIQHGVELIGSSCIEIGNGVNIFKGVRLDAKGHKHNRIYIQNWVTIERNVDIGSMDNTSIYIGENTYIAPGVCIAGQGDIHIGKNCMIAANCGIYANNHVFTDLLLPIKQQGTTREGIIIEDDCWLGHGVTVLDGVKIGKGSIIGAGAVVSKNIPPYSIAVGVPAKVIKDRVVNIICNS
ncbi:acyltransferase [Cuspidothrix issatschenkoi LEGE 03284]|uniref:acyltransferase n=1 Tax=Cuspidothrix issatschenkoi TaxID=230752 RepID=UPI0018829752|nr:acyltransferase [Cuspidothrix issatschenkoi]MBE9230873.1 acyltransferase [Cuspidothrix issatschenkoi LEGE 03284]